MIYIESSVFDVHQVHLNRGEQARIPFATDTQHQWTWSESKIGGQKGLGEVDGQQQGDIRVQAHQPCPPPPQAGQLQVQAVRLGQGGKVQKQTQISFPAETGCKRGEGEEGHQGHHGCWQILQLLPDGAVDYSKLRMKDIHADYKKADKKVA